MCGVSLEWCCNQILTPKDRKDRPKKKQRPPLHDIILAPFQRFPGGGNHGQLCIAAMNIAHIESEIKTIKWLVKYGKNGIPRKIRQSTFWTCATTLVYLNEARVGDDLAC